VKYKVEEDWMPIISSPSGIVVYASPSTGAEGKDPVADIGKLRKAQLIMGGKHIIASELGTLLSLDLLGVKVKAVFGLDRGPARLGFQRGEFNIAYDSAASYLAQAVPLVQKGEAIPLFTLGFMDQSGKVVRDPSFPDLPSFPEVYKLVLGKELAGPEYQAWLSIFSVNVMASKGLALPGGTSDEVITAYTDALRKAVADPDYKAHAAEFVGNYPQVIGKPAKQVVDAGATMNDEARSWLREWLRVNYDENIK
jgi:hypothetical protein